MPTPNSVMSSDVKINVVSSNNEEATDVILLPSDDTNMDTFPELPLEFDSSNNTIGMLGPVDNSTTKMDAALPMLTDIAEETIYETEFFEETLKLEDDLIRQNDDDDAFVQENNDISNILMETVTAESNEAVENDNNYDQPVIVQSLSENKLDGDDFLDSQVLETVGESGENGAIVSDEPVNGASIANSSSANDISSLITVSNNTNLVSNLLKNSDTAALNKIASADAPEKANNINIEFLTSPKSSMFTNLSNVIHINAIGGGNKISTLQPITVQSAPKLVPISIASAGSIKRSAVISVGPSSANVLTKVIVSQGKSGQPIRILPNTAANSSPMKSITAAQAKQMGIKLQPIRPSATTATTKPFRQKIILSNITPRAPVLKNVQSSLSKPATPTKILPAPLVSTSVTGSQSQKIILNSDYLVKAGAIIPKVSTGQVIVSNLKPASIVTNHSGSPKKQVQYIKLINNSIGSTNLPTVTTAKSRFTAVTQNSTIAKLEKESASPIIVAAPSNFSTTKLNIKTINSAPANHAASTSSLTVLPVLPTPAVKSTPGQRLILPAVAKTTDNVNQPAIVNETKQTKSSGSASVVYLADQVLKKVPIDLHPTTVKLKEEPKFINETAANISYDVPDISLEPRSAKSPPRYTPSFETGGGLKSRKPCNCTRSQCLKLYCECFANGEFCNNCNCTSCHNNIHHEENRQSAIKSCLDRNPQAFRPKIGKCLIGLSDRRHTKGCHCKRSGCLKNYCECYEAQIPCSENCKCVGCKNIDDGLFSTSCSTGNVVHDKSDQSFEFQTMSKNKLTAEINNAVGRSGPANPRQAFSFIKDQVVEATCQCLLAQAEDVKRRKVDMEDGKKYILEEFGRCLIQIIECAPDKYVSS